MVLSFKLKAGGLTILLIVLLCFPTRLPSIEARSIPTTVRTSAAAQGNDITVISGDDRVITPTNPFDLNGRAVQFSPVGTGYTVSSGAGVYEAAIGEKLDLTTAPAINPRIGTQPGDDAVLNQTIGFSFPFYGVSFTNVGVTSNGNLVFRPAGITNEAYELRAVESIESRGAFEKDLPRIAPYWHDLTADASHTSGQRGVYIRRDLDRTIITWTAISDFPNDPGKDNGIHSFQVSLFRDGRIVFTYGVAQLTSRALVGVSNGLSQTATLINLNNPSSGMFSTPVAEMFSTSTIVDLVESAKAFYASPGIGDDIDFIYLFTDFPHDLGGGFSYFLGLSNDVKGIGQPVEQSPLLAEIGSEKLQGILNLNDIAHTYPDSPAERFLGGYHGLSILARDQGHRWLSSIRYPNDPTLLLGRENAYWSFFLNTESTSSAFMARRSSAAEGNAWRENNDGSFTSVSLVDGYSLLDQYLMGFRSPGEIPQTFVIAPAEGTTAARDSTPAPNITIQGTRRPISIEEILRANGVREPSAQVSPKNFRAAFVLLIRQGATANPATVEKLTRYRLAWESYFYQSTDRLASVTTGVSKQATPQVIATTSAASFSPTLAPGEIAALFGGGLTAGEIVAAGSQPLPTTLAGAEIRINGVPAPLFYVSPTQINFQVPRNITAVTEELMVSSATALVEAYLNGRLIRAGAFQIAPSCPAVFTTTQNGTGPAAAVDALTGASFPFNARQVSGDPNIIAVFGSGFGADITDTPGSVKVEATIDGIPCSVLYAGQAPGFTGLNQINLAFPPDLSSGVHRLILWRNGIPSQETTITIR
jgi:uncharacterized protein (TIGR03437 family)